MSSPEACDAFMLSIKTWVIHRVRFEIIERNKHSSQGDDLTDTPAVFSNKSQPYCEPKGNQPRGLGELFNRNHTGKLLLSLI